MNDYKKLLNKHYAQQGQHFTHCAKPTDESSGGRYSFGREGFEELLDLHSDLVMNDPAFLSSTLEMPQHYSMLRVDMDYKVVGATAVKPLYKVFDAVNLIKKIQEYLKQNIDGVKPEHLRCAFLTKDPYISKDGDLRHSSTASSPNKQTPVLPNISTPWTTTLTRYKTTRGSFMVHKNRRNRDGTAWNRLLWRTGRAKTPRNISSTTTASST